MAYNAPTISFTALLPWLPGPVNLDSFIDVQITSSGPLNPGAPGNIYDAWCLDRSLVISPGAYTAQLYSSYELTILQASRLGSLTFTQAPYINNLDNINWLLNQDFNAGPTYSWREVQAAIWLLSGSDPVGSTSIVGYDAAEAATLVNLAQTNGEGFVPGLGQTIGLILDTGDLGTNIQRQPLILEVKSAALGDFVWNDANANGIQDSGEAGIQGATVKLVRDLDKSGTITADEVLATTTTNSSGLYSFTGLTPGLDYQVQFTQPGGLTPSPRQVDGNPTSGVNSDGLLSNVVVLAPGENNTSIDAGFFDPTLLRASLGDRLWVDTNADGKQDTNTTLEPGVVGATVTLIGGGADGLINGVGDTTTTTTTGANGVYTFTNLTPGVQYQVQFTAPNGTVFTTPNVSANGFDAVDSDADKVTGKSQVITLAPGENNTSVDAGVYAPAKLSGYVYQDAGNDGVRNNEPGINGVVLTLTGTDNAGNAVNLTTTTNSLGFYEFVGLAPGNYAVTETQPGGFIDGKDTPGSTGGSNATNDVISAITLTAGANSTENNFGELVSAGLGDRLWVDTDGDGKQSADQTAEPGIGNQVITLIGGGADGIINGIGDTTATTTTFSNGFYSFVGLTPGVEYQVQFSKPAGTVFTSPNVTANTFDTVDSDANTTTGRSQVVTLGQGEFNSTIDAGVYTPAKLSGYVYQDVGNDGVRNNEPGIGGVVLTLTGTDNAGNSVTGTATTNTAGFYEFVGLPPGKYTVSEAQPNGFLDGKDTIGSTGGTVANDLLSNITLASGSNSTENNFGELKPASLGDRLWVDTNGDGKQDANTTTEPGVVGAVVTLIGGGADGLINGVGDTTATTTTGANGVYAFTNLTPGVQYQVQFVAPAGTVFTTPNVSTNGFDEIDSDANKATGLTQVVTLGQGEDNRTLDAGVYAPGKLTGFVYVDSNDDGSRAGEAPIQGVVLTLSGTDNAGNVVTGITTTTDGSGFYQFTNLAPGSYTVTETQPANFNDGKDTVGTTGGSNAVNDVLSSVTVTAGGTSAENNFGERTRTASLGDRLWVDTNGDGKQDANTTTEPGVVGAVVTLIGGGADGLINGVGDTTATTTTGTNGVYAFTNLTPGVQYQVQFAAPAGTVFTTPNVSTNGFDLVDSDANKTTGRTQIVTLADNENNTSLDAGVYAPGKLTGFVYVDSNDDGSRAGEAPIQGVTLTLSGVDNAGNVITGVTTVTEPNGFYEFTNLAPGSYTVTETQPANFNDGKDTVGTTGGSNAVNDVLSGIAVTAGGVSNENNFGERVQTASLGDRLWVDTNGDGKQDANTTTEPGVVGAVVTLIGGGADGLINGVGDTTATTTTGANGVYGFTNLTPGVQYQVQFAAPAGTVFTTPNVSANGFDLVDSDADKATGRTQIVTLAANENNTSLDAGVVTLTPRIDIEKTTIGAPNANPIAVDYDNEDTPDGVGVPLLTPGSHLNWFYQVTNTGNVPFARSDITLVDDNGTVGNTADDFSIANGQISFVAGDIGNDNILSPGELWLYRSSGVAQNLSGGLSPNTVTFDFQGNTALDGPDGNTRSFSAGGVSVNVNAFSRDKTTGAWEKAYLGAYGGGLGVTDTSEGDGTSSNGHTVDNLGGRDNYTVFSFNQNVVVDSAYLGFVVGDSDAQVWIGTLPTAFTAGVTLSDAVLASLGFTQVDATALTTSRVADFNNGHVAGNVLVIAADTTDTTPEDSFKIESLTLRTVQGGGVYGNTATVTAPGAPSDSDKSHYKNPAPARLGDFLFEDTNGNGIQDPLEPGIGGVVVSLKNAAGTVINTTTTSATGAYGFDVTPGTYSLQFATPAGGFVFTRRDAGADDAKDSDVDATGNTGQYTVVAGQSNPTIDAGVYKTAAIGDRVWHDINGNGIQEAHEPGVANIKIDLLNVATGAIVGTRTTDANGNYLFSNLVPGSYQIDVAEETLPDGYVFTRANQGSDEAVDSDVETLGGTVPLAWGVMASTTLTSGELDRSWDAGIYKGGKVAGYVSHDLYNDGNRNGDPAISGVTIHLSGTTVNGESFTASTTTDVSGYYQFTGLEAGTYVATEIQPAGFTDGKDTAGTVGSTVIGNDKIQVVLPASGMSHENNFFERKTGSIGDFLFIDSDYDGIQEAHEVGLGGVNVALTYYGRDGLLGTSDDVKFNTTTSATGAYLFTDLDTGKYKIDFGHALAQGYLFTKQDQGPSMEVDSDVNSAGVLENISLAAGEHNKKIDAGVYKTAAIGDRIWHDINGNGIQEAHEPGVAGVTVNLRDTVGQWGNVLRSTVTDANGNYLFSNLTPGDYYIDVVEGTLPAGYVFTRSNQGADDQVDSDVGTVDLLGNTIPLNFGAMGKTTLTSGELDRSFDAGIYKGGKVAGFVSHDLNNDGLRSGDPAISGVTIHLSGTTVNGASVTASTTTDGSGYYQFIDLEAGTYVATEVQPAGFSDGKDTAGTVGSTVIANDKIQVVLAASQMSHENNFFERKADGLISGFVSNDLSNNGIRNGDPAISGVTVTLTGTTVTGQSVTATCVTDGSGFYKFSNLAEGTYHVTETQPAGWIDGMDMAGSLGSTVVANDQIRVVLPFNGVSLENNFFEYKKAAVGDKVWSDSNHNGIQDTGEAGIGSIRVTLFNATTNAAVGTMHTNASGNYSFTNLDPGSYYLQFDKTNVIFSGVNLNTWKWGLKDIGTNDHIDSDANNPGSTVNITRTDAFTLTSGLNDTSRDAAITPLVIDMDGNGIRTVSLANSSGTFDLLGNGTAIKSGWISAGDAFLAVDKDSNGSIDSVNELFGGTAKGAGFAALASYDSNKDGLVDGADADFAKLLVWQDANGDHQSSADELRTLAEAGIASLTVAHTDLQFLDAQGNVHGEASSVTTTSGTTLGMTDIYFSVDAADVAGTALPSVSELLGNTSLDSLVGAAELTTDASCLKTEEAGDSGAGEALSRLAALHREDQLQAA